MFIFCPPACLARSIIISMTEAAIKESSPLVGSSQNSSGGFVNTYEVHEKTTFYSNRRKWRGEKKQTLKKL
jgi:hypothetical protein